MGHTSMEMATVDLAPVDVEEDLAALVGSEVVALSVEAILADMGMAIATAIMAILMATETAITSKSASKSHL